MSELAAVIRMMIQLGEPTQHEPEVREVLPPHPSTTPPMWADDVNRSRRPKRHRNQPNRQGTR